MQLKQQVCSLELAKKLKELGVEQESLFYWDESPDEENAEVFFQRGQKDDLFNRRYISAFTVAELGEMLPKGNFSIRYIGVEKWEAGNNITTYLGMAQGGPKCDLHIEEADTEATARAKMLIHLIKNNLYAPDQKSVGS